MRVHHLGSLLVAIAFVAVATARGEGSDQAAPTPTTEALLGRYERICDEHRPATVGETDLALASGATAGLIAQLAENANVDPSPWDTLPPEHVAARCIYASGGLRSASPDDVLASPTTVCPNGDIVSLAEPPTHALDFWVDEDGHVSPNKVPDPAGAPPDICTAVSDAG